MQEAAMPPLLQDALEDADVELDDVRKRMGAALGAGDQDLIKLRRVTWGSILNLALLVFAAYALIGLLGDVDMADVRSKRSARPAGGGSASPWSSPRCRASRRR